MREEDRRRRVSYRYVLREVFPNWITFDAGIDPSLFTTIRCCFVTRIMPKRNAQAK